MMKRYRTFKKPCNVMWKPFSQLEIPSPWNPPEMSKLSSLPPLLSIYEAVAQHYGSEVRERLAP